MEGNSTYPGAAQTTGDMAPQQPVYGGGAQYPGAAPGGPVMQATPIAVEGQYGGAAPQYGMTGGYQTGGAGYPTYAGQPMYQGQQPMQQQQMMMGAGQPVYGGQQQGMMYPPPQPQVVYVAGPPRGYGYGYSDRARLVYWGNPWVRMMTIIFIIMVIIGIVLEATSPTGCRSGCSSTTCYDNYGNSYDCTCDNNTVCENQQFGPQGQAGAALISIGVVALIVQSCIACGCCGSCCLPPPPPMIVNQPRPQMLIVGSAPAGAPVVVGRAY